MGPIIARVGMSLARNALANEAGKKISDDNPQENKKEGQLRSVQNVPMKGNVLSFKEFKMKKEGKALSEHNKEFNEKLLKSFNDQSKQLSTLTSKNKELEKTLKYESEKSDGSVSAASAFELLKEQRRLQDENTKNQKLSQELIRGLGVLQKGNEDISSSIYSKMKYDNERERERFKTEKENLDEFKQFQEKTEKENRLKQQFNKMKLFNSKKGAKRGFSLWSLLGLGGVAAFAFLQNALNNEHFVEFATAIMKDGVQGLWKLIDSPELKKTMDLSVNAALAQGGVFALVKGFKGIRFAIKVLQSSYKGLKMGFSSLRKNFFNFRIDMSTKLRTAWLRTQALFSKEGLTNLGRKTVSSAKSVVSKVKNRAKLSMDNMRRNRIEKLEKKQDKLRKSQVSLADTDRTQRKVQTRQTKLNSTNQELDRVNNKLKNKNLSAQDKINLHERRGKLLKDKKLQSESLKRAKKNHSLMTRRRRSFGNTLAMFRESNTNQKISDIKKKISTNPTVSSKRSMKSPVSSQNAQKVSPTQIKPGKGPNLQSLRPKTKVPGAFSRVLKTIGKFGRIIPGIGQAIMLASQAYSAYEGWSNAQEILGVDEKKVKLAHKIQAQTGQLIQDQSWGMIPAQSTAKAVYTVQNWMNLGDLGSLDEQKPITELSIEDIDKNTKEIEEKIKGAKGEELQGLNEELQALKEERDSRIISDTEKDERAKQNEKKELTEQKKKEDRTIEEMMSVVMSFNQQQLQNERKPIVHASSIFESGSNTQTNAIGVL